MQKLPSVLRILIFAVLKQRVFTMGNWSQFLFL